MLLKRCPVAVEHSIFSKEIFGGRFSGFLDIVYVRFQLFKSKIGLPRREGGGGGGGMVVI